MPDSDTETVVPAGGTAVAERPAEQLIAQTPWVTIVWDDPVNLMSYVTHVFVSYFNYPKKKAEKLMLQVHHEGKAIVSQWHPGGDGTRRDGDARVRVVGHLGQGRRVRLRIRGRS